MCTLIVDTREQSIIPYINEYANQVAIHIKQITVGDYIILAPNGSINVAIERKTLSDYAASIIDRRIENIKKMMDLRSKTNCELFFIVEGETPADENELYGGIKYKNIQSHMFHMMIRDNVKFLYTNNHANTARTLVNLVLSMDTLYNASQKIGGDIILDELNSYKKTDIDIVYDMFSAIPGISVNSAKYYAVNPMSHYLSDPSKLSEIRLNNNRKVSQTVIGAFTKLDNKYAIKVLSQIPQVTIKSAKILVELYGIYNIWNVSDTELAVYINSAAVSNIKKYFNQSHTPPRC